MRALAPTGTTLRAVLRVVGAGWSSAPGPLTPRRGGTGKTDHDDRESRSLPSVRLSQMRVRFLPVLRPRPADVRALWQAQPPPTPILDVRPVPFAQGFRLGRHPRSPPRVSAVCSCRRVAAPFRTRIVPPVVRSRSDLGVCGRGPGALRRQSRFTQLPRPEGSFFSALFMVLNRGERRAATRRSSYTPRSWGRS